MTVGRIFLFVLLIVTSVFTSCSDNNSPSKAPRQTPAPTNAPFTEEPVADKSEETQESPSAKTLESYRENKTSRIGTSPTGKDAELNQTRAAPPVVVPAKKSAPAGPSGYISRTNVVLQSEPAQNAPKIRSFNQYDEVIILETKMTDEAGNAGDVPKWYKVQCTDKKTGWVVARSVTVN